MLKRLLTFFSFCIILSSCKKDDDVCPYSDSGIVVPASEMANLQTYVAANHPLAVLHAGGFYYEIITAGTGTVTPSVCSNITVKYAGYLTNGFKFTSPAEETTGAIYTLGQLIVGWQRGIPLVKAGATIKLYIPPSLGYGSTASASIPANSILIFNIQLIDVQ